MLRTISLSIVFLMIVVSPVPAIEKGGVSVPDTLTLEAGAGDLVLNGAGIRKKLGFKVYVGGLYLKGKTANSQMIIDADEPMAITMHWLRTGPVDKVTETYTEGFKYSAPNPSDALKADIDIFLNALQEARKGDVWKLIYNPGRGTAMYLNDELSVSFNGLEFKKALFGIWLLESGAFTGDENLRDGMLGK